MKSKNLLLIAFRLTAVAAFTLFATLPLAAQGARDPLQGTYFSTGAQACLVSPLGFTNQAPNNVALAFVQSASLQGTYTFRADGTGTAQFKELVITHPPATNAGASSTEQSFSFTHTVAHDGSLTVVTGLVSGTILTGSLQNVKFTLADSPLMTGRIERNGTDIALSTTDPSVETLILELSQPLALPRLCHRSRILIPVHVNEEN
jgi:hypothetical protein